MSTKRLGRVCTKSTALFLCDMQEKFRRTIQYYPQILNVSNRMLKAAETLQMPIVVTEQYRKGLGPTVSELDVSKCSVFNKTRFSMIVPEVENHLKTLPNVKSVILCGIESQACILQTALDLIEKDYEVHVVADAVSSRSMVDRMFALERMKEAGAFISTSESLMLMLCQDATHPKFREIQKLIWEPAPDSGLLSRTADTSV